MNETTAMPIWDAVPSWEKWSKALPATSSRRPMARENLEEREDRVEEGKRVRERTGLVVIEEGGRKKEGEGVAQR